MFKDMDDLKNARLFVHPNKMYFIAKLSVPGHISANFCSPTGFSGRRSTSFKEFPRKGSTGNVADSSVCGLENDTDLSSTVQLNSIAMNTLRKNQNRYVKSFMSTDLFYRCNNDPGCFNSGYNKHIFTHFQELNALIRLNCLSLLSFCFENRKEKVQIPKDLFEILEQPRYPVKNTLEIMKKKEPIQSVCGEHAFRPNGRTAAENITERSLAPTHSDFNRLQAHSETSSLPKGYSEHVSVVTKSKSPQRDTHFCDRRENINSANDCENNTQALRELGQFSCEDALTPSQKACKKANDVSQKKKRRKPRPSKKKRIRLKLQRANSSTVSCGIKSKNESTSVQVVVGLENALSVTVEESSDNTGCSQISKSPPACSNFSFFFSGSDLDSSESESLDNESNDFDSDLWNTLSQSAINVPFVCWISVPDSVVEEANKKWKKCYGDVLCKGNHGKKTKVSFASEQNLVMTTFFEDNAVERKGPWEEMARDRARFENRIRDVEKTIGRVFESSHREFVYRTYFSS